MIRCYNCQRKVHASTRSCPFCGRDPWMLEDPEEFVIQNGVLLRYNGVQKDVVLPCGVQAIGESAFEDTAVRCVCLPSGTVEIGRYAFYACSSLNYVEIPPSVLRIESYAFSGCRYLKTVTVSKACTIDPSAFDSDVTILYHE